jgi:hypothetical protein
MAYGLLKAKGWARTIVRVLSVFTMAATLLTMIVVAAVPFPVLSLAAACTPLTGGMIAIVYRLVALLIVMGIISMDSGFRVNTNQLHASPLEDSFLQLPCNP